MKDRRKAAGKKAMKARSHWGRRTAMKDRRKAAGKKATKARSQAEPKRTSADGLNTYAWEETSDESEDSSSDGGSDGELSPLEYPWELGNPHRWETRRDKDGQTYSYAQFFSYYWALDTYTRKDLDDYWETLPLICFSDQGSRGSTPGMKTKGMKMKAMNKKGMKTKGMKKIRVLTKKVLVLTKTVQDLTERVAMLELKILHR